MVSGLVFKDLRIWLTMRRSHNSIILSLAIQDYQKFISSNPIDLFDCPLFWIIYFVVSGLEFQVPPHGAPCRHWAMSSFFHCFTNYELGDCHIQLYWLRLSFHFHIFSSLCVLLPTPIFSEAMKHPLILTDPSGVCLRLHSIFLNCVMLSLVFHVIKVALRRLPCECACQDLAVPRYLQWFLWISHMFSCNCIAFLLIFCCFP